MSEPTTPELPIHPPVRETTPVKEDDWKEMFARARDVSETAFRCTMGGGFASSRDELFSGDAATIYSLVSTDDGQEKLIPLGWGEFSREVFETDRYPAFKQAPYDIFVVRQHDSYFADDKLRDMMRDNPREFLQQKAMMVARQGKATGAEKVGDGYERQLTNHDFQAVPYQDFMADTRNLILHTRTISSLEEPIDLDDFARFVGEIPKDPTELKQFIAKTRSHNYFTPRDMHEREITDGEKQAQRESDYLGHMFGMGVYRVGILVGDEKAMRSIADLADSFDQQTKAFKPQAIS